MPVKRKVSKVKIANNRKIHPQNENSLLSVLNAMSEFTILIDTKGTILRANKASAKIKHGKTANTAGKNLFDQLPPGLTALIKKNTGISKKNGKPVSFEFYEKEKWTEYTIYPAERGNAGSVKNFVITGKDISERKKSEEAVRKSEQKYHSLFSEMIDGCTMCRIVYDRKGNPADYITIEVNKSFEKMLGAHKDLVIGKKAGSILPKNELKSWLDIFTPIAIHGGSKEYQHYSPLNKKYFEGNVFSFEKDIFFVTFRDVTERKLADKALKKQHSILQKVMDGAKNIHLVYLDRDFNFVRVNEAYAKTCGYKPEEMIGKNHFSMYPHTENEAIFKRVRDTGKPFEIKDKQFVFPDQPERGVTFWDWSLLPVKDGSGKVEGLIFSLVETTCRKKTEQEILHDEARMKSLVRILQNPAKTIHEFLDYTLSEALKLTESKMGFICHYSEKKKQFILHAWSEGVMADCKISNPPTIYDLDKTGIWGEAVRQRSPIIINDFHADNPLKKGYPPGHVSVDKFLAVPIFEKGEIVAVIAVANKAEDYNSKDILQLTLLMEVIWKATGRMKAEEDLRKSEEKYSMLFNKNVTPALLFKLPEVVIEDVNQAAEKLCGYTRKELIGQSPVELGIINSEDRKHILDEFRAKGSLYGYELSINTKKGETRFVISNINKLQMEEEYFALNTMVDVTEQRLTKEALQLSNERLGIALSASHAGIWDWEITNNTFYWSKEFLDLFGMDENVVPCFESWKAVLHPDDVETAGKNIQKSIDNRTNLVNDYRIILPDSSIRWIRAIGKTEYEKKKPVRMSGICLDITELKKADEEILRNESRMESLVRILQSPAKTIQEFLDHALNEAIALTESKIGYIYHYNEEKKQFILNTWSKDVMAECRVTNPQSIYDLDKTGIWGEAVRQRKPIMVNDFHADNPHKKGYPPGHVRLDTFLTVPVFDKAKIVAVVGVANKKEAYNSSDILQLTLLMESVWKVTSRMKAEEQLRNSEERYRTLFEKAPIGILHYDQDTVITSCNDAATEIVELPSSKIIGVNLLSIIKDETQKKALVDTMKGIPSSYEGKYKFEISGITKYISTIYSPIFDSSGKISGGISVTEDITEKKKSEKALQESESRYRSIVENITDAIFIHDLNGTITDLNENAIKMLGYSREELIGRNVKSLLPAENAKPFSKRREYLLENKSILFESAHIRKDGSVIPIEVSIKVVSLEGAGILQAFTRDITDRRLAKNALLESEKQYRTIVENLNDALYLHDSEGKIIDVNENAVKMLGYSREEFLRINLNSLMPEEQKILFPKRQQFLRKNDSIVFEGAHIRKDGSLLPVEVSVKVVSRKDKSILQAFVRDITERKKAELELINQKKRTDSILAGVADTFYSVDKSWKFSIVNPAAEKEPFGRPASELIGKVIWDVYPGLVGTQIHKHYINAAEKHSLEHYEAQSPLNKHWYEVFMQGWEGGVDIYMRDITEKRNAEIHLKEITERLSLAASSAKLGIWDWNVQENTLVWDDRMFELYGITRDTFPNNLTAWTKGLHPEDIDFAVEESRKALAGEKEYNTEFRVVQPNGNIVYIKANGLVIRDNTGKAMRMIGINFDVTDRKKAEESLHYSETRYRELFDNIGSGVAIYEAVDNGNDFIFTDFNRAAEKTDKESRENLIGKSVLAARPGIKDFGLFEVFRRVLATGKPEKLPISNYKDNKLEGWYENYVYKLPSGELVAVFNDLTEQKRAEQSLQFSETRFRELFDNIGSGVAIYEAVNNGNDFIFKDFNKAAEKLYNISREDIKGQSIQKIFPGVKEFGLFDAFKCVWKTGLPKFHPVSLYKDDKVTGWYENYVYKLPTGEIVAVFENLTDRKQAEEALQASEEHYKHLIESVSDYIYSVQIKNGKAVKTEHGHGCIAVTGFTCQELESDPNLWFNMIYGEDREYVNREMDKILKGINVPPFEHRIYRKDGAIRWVRNTPILKKGESGKIISYDGMISDITERKIAEESEAKAQAQLRQAQKMEALGTFVGGIAHDFNNILGVLMGYTNLMGMELEEGHPLSSYVEQIFKSSEKAANLTKSLLSFSRNQPVSRKPVNLNNVITEIEKLLKRLITEDISLEINPYKNDVIITGDQSQIDQILFNLSTNARDAMPNGGTITIVTNKVEIDEGMAKTIGYIQPGIYAVISFTDTGTGMDQKTIENIFDPFFTTKEVGKGTGLGMATVYGIVKQHNGYIQVLSEKGEGTTFNIYLPVSQGSLEAEKKETHEIKTGTETILIAEDYEGARLITRTMLEKRGYKVIEAVDGEDAVAKFKNFKDIKLVIIDSVMPKKNGREVYDEIKKINPEIKVLFCSGYTRDVILSKGIEEKEFDFMPKPLQMDKLLLKVREILDRE